MLLVRTRAMVHDAKAPTRSSPVSRRSARASFVPGKVRASFTERFPSHVFRRDNRSGNGPLDSNQWVVPGDSVIVGRIVDGSAFVYHVGNRRQHTEAVREPGRNPER